MMGREAQPPKTRRRQVSSHWSDIKVALRMNHQSARRRRRIINGQGTRTASAAPAVCVEKLGPEGRPPLPNKPPRTREGNRTRPARPKNPKLSSQQKNQKNGAATREERTTFSSQPLSVKTVRHAPFTRRQPKTTAPSGGKASLLTNTKRGPNAQYCHGAKTQCVAELLDHQYGTSDLPGDNKSEHCSTPGRKVQIKKPCQKLRCRPCVNRHEDGSKTRNTRRGRSVSRSHKHPRH